jgi:colanic acid biosynthesis glycosyl transferase WcaI
MGQKVLIFNRSFYPDVTATGQLLTELAVDLVRTHGCEVTVVCGRPLISSGGSPLPQYPRGKTVHETHRGVSIVRVGNTAHPPASFRGRISNYLSYFFLAWRELSRLPEPDLVMTLTDPPIVVLLGCRAAKRWKIPFVVSLRDLFPEAAGGLKEGRNSLINCILDAVNKYCLRRADRVVALGELMRQRLVEAKGVEKERVEIITDWADTELIVPAQKDNPVSRALGLQEGFVVMYAGNLGASSGLEFVLDAAALLAGHADIRFVFVGEGVMKEPLRLRAQELKLSNVRFLPFQPKENISGLFASADVFLIPLKQGLGGYSVPSKAYAVFASGRPYVASIESASELAVLTREAQCGLVAAPQDAAALKEALLWMYAHPAERQEMGTRSRELSSRFNRSKGVAHYYELFTRVCRSQKDP